VYGNDRTKLAEEAARHPYALISMVHDVNLSRVNLDLLNESFANESETEVRLTGVKNGFSTGSTAAFVVSANPHGPQRGLQSAPRPGEGRAKALCARANEACSDAGDTIARERRAWLRRGPQPYVGRPMGCRRRSMRQTRPHRRAEAIEKVCRTHKKVRSSFLPIAHNTICDRALGRATLRVRWGLSA